MRRAALYIRVSTEEQARHGLSLGEQQNDLMKYAEKHGYEVVGIYADEGFTARKSISKRLQLQRMLDDIRAGKIDVIVMKCLDRWFRNIADYYKVQEILDKHGVLWECTQEEYNTTTSHGRLLLNVKLSVAQNESDLTSERIRYVFDGKRERREFVGGLLPFGYKRDGLNIVIDEENATVVRHMFNHVCKGHSIRMTVGEIFKRFGIKKHYNTILYALRNRAYIGELYGISGYISPIIEYNTFQEVQEILKSKNIKTTPSGRIYLFSNLIRCPSCGRTLSANRGQPNCHGEYLSPRYRCTTAIRNSEIDMCSFRRAISERKIEKYLLSHLQKMAKNHIYAIDVMRSGHENGNLDSEIETLKAKLGKLKELYLEDLIDKATYRVDYENLSRELSTLMSKKNRIVQIPAKLQEIVDATDFLETYENLSRENKRAFWQLIIAKISFDDTPETRGRGAVIPFRVEFR